MSSRSAVILGCLMWLTCAYAGCASDPGTSGADGGGSGGSSGSAGTGGTSGNGGGGGDSGSAGDGGGGGDSGSGGGVDAGVDASDDASVSPATGCEPLPAPTGSIVNVDSTMGAALPAMVRSATAGTTFVLADGTYTMTGDENARRLQIRADDITIRSASGNAAAVVIDGEYITAEIIGVYASRFTLAEVTITRAVDHAVHVTPSNGGPNLTGTRLYGVQITDCGEQFVKVNPPSNRDAFADDGIVECSTFTMTDTGRPHVERSGGGCYTGGIDAHASRGWIVRQNIFRDIYCAGEGLAEHAVHFWTGSRDTIVERNTIIDCARGIGFGLIEGGQTRAYTDDPYPGLFVGHFDGIIRNNVIVATHPYYDTGVELAQARGALVLHNTILETDGATGRFSSIDARFPNTAATIRNNLVRRRTVRNDAVTTSDHNVDNVPLDYVGDAAGGDAHLTSNATLAIGQGQPHPEAGLDIDGEPHHATMPDIGADAH